VEIKYNISALSLFKLLVYDLIINLKANLIVDYSQKIILIYTHDFIISTKSKYNCITTRNGGVRMSSLLTLAGIIVTSSITGLTAIAFFRNIEEDINIANRH
jgi:hypothetical protein